MATIMAMLKYLSVRIVFIKKLSFEEWVINYRYNNTREQDATF